MIALMLCAAVLSNEQNRDKVIYLFRAHTVKKYSEEGGGVLSLQKILMYFFSSAGYIVQKENFFFRRPELRHELQ